MPERFSLGANYWSRAGATRMWSTFDEEEVREELAWARSIGLDVLRWFLYWPDLEPRPGEMAEGCWEHVHRFLDLAQEAKLGTFPTLLVGHMSGQNWDPPWRDGRDLWQDPFMLEQEEWFIGESVARLASHPAVRGWVLTNEWPLYAGHTTVPVFRHWLHRMTAAVRQRDPEGRPISVGDGLWGAMGSPNGIDIYGLWEQADLVGPHVYPEEESPLVTAMTAYEAVALARGPRPVLLEEFGTTDGFGSEASQARYYRSVLAGSLIGGAGGAWAWCLNDFELTHQAPYNHHPFELRFGLFRTDGEPKLTARAMAEFRPVADSFGTVQFDPVALVLPAFQAGELPFERGPEARVMTETARLTLRSLAGAGVNPDVVREPLPDVSGEQGRDVALDTRIERARLLLLAAPRVAEPTRKALWALAAEGRVLYLAYSDTSWFHDPERLLGVSWEGPYGVRPRLRGRHVARVEGWPEPIGFVVDDPNGLLWRRAESRGALPLAWVDEVPVVFGYRVGLGWVITSVIQVEAVDGIRLGLYKRLLELARVGPPIPIPPEGWQVGISTSGQVLVMNHNEAAGQFPGQTGDGRWLRDLSGKELSAPVGLEPHQWWHGLMPVPGP